MEKNLYIDASHPNETRVVLKSDDNIEDYEYEGLKNNLIKNNIYLGKVSRIEPSLQAAFIDFGRERHGFLSFNDIQSDYYQIPKADLDRIKEEEEKAREELSKEVEAKEEENIAEGKLEIDDPINIEKDPAEDNENGSDQKNNLSDEKDKKKETKFKFKRYKIQEVIKPNQVILVQVIKDERGQKGAALSTFISIAGKYIVLMPNTPKGGGISRKIFNPADRKKIRNILNEIEIPKYRSNLTLLEAKGQKWCRKMVRERKIYITRVDKGGCIIILNASDVDVIMRKTLNSDNFQKIEKDPCDNNNNVCCPYP